MRDENTSRLLECSASLRIANISRNCCLYTEGCAYSAEHPNALSDNDEKGRDPIGDSGTIGTCTDINQRDFLTVRNCYNDKPYGPGNC